MGTLFVAGVYGVGKSTLCQKLSEILKIPTFSAGDLISSINREQYGANKIVSDKVANQDILALEVDKCLQKHPKILLAGHFCIFNNEKQVDCLPENIYERLNIESILLLEADKKEILEHLSQRDCKSYSYDQISELRKAEHRVAQRVAYQIGSDIYIHKMRFDETDIDICLSYLRGDKI